MRRSFKTSLLVLTLALAAAPIACAPKNPSVSKYIQPEALQPKGEVRFPSEDEAKEAKKRVLVSCAASKEPGDCPEAVSMIVVHSGGEKVLGLCSAFLIAPDLAATNSHCIPEALKKAPDQCGSHLKFHFAETAGAPAEIVSCTQVLSFSDLASHDTMTVPDYAFVKLEKSLARKPFELDRVTGIEPDSRVKVARVNPVRDAEGRITPEGRIEVIECRAVANTFVLPFYSSARDPLFSLRDCPIVQGNSGSAVLSDSGGIARAVGIIQGNFKTDVFNSALFSEGVPQLGFGTSFGCMAETVPESCKLDFSMAAQDALRGKIISKQLTDNRASTEQWIAGWEKANPPSFFRWQASTVWQDSTRDYTYFTTPVPRCLRMTGEWITQVKNGELRTTVLHHVSQFQFDSALRLIPKPHTATSQESIELLHRIDAEAVKTSKKTLLRTESVPHFLEIFQGEVRSCS